MPNIKKYSRMFQRINDTLEYGISSTNFRLLLFKDYSLINAVS